MNFPWKPSPVLNPCCLGLTILGCFCFLQEHDEPILKHLQDITVKFSEPGEPMVCQTAKQASVYYWHFLTNKYRFLIRFNCLSKQSFTLEFHFEPNSYFSNTVLTKVYKMKSEPEAADPFSFEGPEIIDCEG